MEFEIVRVAKYAATTDSLLFAFFLPLSYRYYILYTSLASYYDQPHSTAAI